MYLVQKCLNRKNFSEFVIRLRFGLFTNFEALQQNLPIFWLSPKSQSFEPLLTLVELEQPLVNYWLISVNRYRCVSRISLCWAAALLFQASPQCFMFSPIVVDCHCRSECLKMLFVSLVVSWGAFLHFEPETTIHLCPLSALLTHF